MDKTTHITTVLDADLEMTECVEVMAASIRKATEITAEITETCPHCAELELISALMFEFVIAYFAVGNHGSGIADLRKALATVEAYIEKEFDGNKTKNQYKN